MTEGNQGALLVVCLLSAPGRTGKLAETLQTIRRVLTGTRWAIALFVLVTAWTVDFEATTVQRIPIAISVLVISTLTLASGFAARRWEWTHRPVIALTADIALVTAVVYFSDGIESPFYPLYYVVVVIAGVEFGLSGALACASALTIVSIVTDAIAPGVSAIGAVVLTDDIIRTLPYLFLTAVITGALRGRVRVLDETASALRSRPGRTWQKRGRPSSRSAAGKLSSARRLPPA